MFVGAGSYWNQVPITTYTVLEGLGIVVATAGALLTARADSLLWKVEAGFQRVSQRRNLAIALVFLTAIAVRVALLPVLPVPDAGSVDDFSYLLGADTYASGRLTNPSHPLWMHFENHHIIVRPTYQTMYMPGQSLALTMGELLGNPWYGVLLSVAAMCAAVCWCLQGWVSEAWALLGGLLAVSRLCTGHRWMESYWGGAVAGIGGALVLGAVPRLVRSRRVRDSLLLGAGMALLANTRAFEGALFSVLCCVLLAGWLLRERVQWKNVSRAVVLPAVVVLGVTAAAMMYYCWRVTGDALTMPYTVNLREYHITRPFLWQAAQPVPAYRHEILRRAYVDWELTWWPETRTAAGLLFFSLRKLEIYYIFLVFGWAIPFVIGVVYLLRSRQWRPLAAVAFVFTLGLLAETWIAFPHYAAPAIGLLMLVTVLGLHRLRTWNRFAMRFSRTLVITSALLLAVVQVTSTVYYDDSFPEHWYVARERIAAQLLRTPGKHLVIVRYSARHPYLDDWVYNAPDIDGSRIVWAREMGPAENDRLIAYFRNRKVWLVDTDSAIVRPEPYAELPSDTLARNYQAANARAGLGERLKSP
jgi:hypothetical protein